MPIKKANETVTKSRRKHLDRNKRRQVIVRLRIENPECEHDFNVNINDGTPLKLTDAQYYNLTNEHYALITNTKSVIKQSAIYLIQHDVDISLETIRNRLEEIKNQYFIDRMSSFQDKDLEISAEEITKLIQNTSLEDIEDIEDIGDVISSVKIDMDEKARQERIIAAKDEKNTLERAKKQYDNIDWNKNDLILLIGYLFTFEKDNGDPLIHRLNRGILNNLYDYHINTGASLKPRDFDDTYCRNFIKYLVRVGVIKASLGRTPFELISRKYDTFFKEKEHKIITYSTLKDKIKAINSIALNLKNKGLLEHNIKKYSPDTFVKKTVNTKKGSSIDHHLKQDEVQQLLDIEFEDIELNIAKDTFLILVFAGGLRGVSYFDVIIDLKDRWLDVLHSKNEKRRKIPIWGEMDSILKKYNYQFPDFSLVSNLADSLKVIATNLEWKREIKTDNTFVNKKKGDSYYFFSPLNEIVDLTFARKTFVNYARRVYNMPDGEIIQYTGHGSVDLLAYYMGELTLDEMKARISNNE